MTLPHEAEVISDIANKYRAELDAMTSLHDAVVSMLSADSWTIRMRGLNLTVVRTALGLLTKACKTFPSIQLLCELGLIEDADVLTRVLMETSVAIAFILQKNSKKRVAIYHAHSLAQDVKMLNGHERSKRRTYKLDRSPPRRNRFHTPLVRQTKLPGSSESASGGYRIFHSVSLRFIDGSCIRCCRTF